MVIRRIEFLLPDFRQVGIEPAIDPRQPRAREREAPSSGFLPRHAGTRDWPGAAFCGLWRD